MQIPMRTIFASYLAQSSPEGSNKASSYLRALDLLGQILGSSRGPFQTVQDLWQETSPSVIQRLYRYICDQQRLGAKGIFDEAYLPSYWRNGFYSAALRSYGQFLVEQAYERKLDQVESQGLASGKEVARALDQAPLEDADCLAAFEETPLEGKEVVRAVKQRVNQGIFRKMVLGQYRGACAITGLSVPEVLRASHISPWGMDETSRMNPCNGICLSATHDAAFDRGLILFDEEYRMVLGAALRDHVTNAAFKEFFLRYEGQPMTLPVKYLPDLALLRKHRERSVALAA